MGQEATNSVRDEMELCSSCLGIGKLEVDDLGGMTPILNWHDWSPRQQRQADKLDWVEPCLRCRGTGWD